MSAWIHIKHIYKKIHLSKDEQAPSSKLLQINLALRNIIIQII